MLALVVQGRALAHGGRPQTYDVLFAPDDPDVIVVPATFGTLRSDDGGATFSVICLDAMPDPRPGSLRRFAFTPEGTLLVAQEFGLVRGPAHGCGFAYVEGALRDAFVTDVMPLGPDVLVLRSDASTENQVFRASRDGTSVTPLPARFPTEFLPERLRVAPSEPGRWWVSGTARRDGTTFLDGRVYVSRDGGASYESHAFPLETDERRLRVLAVDPRDPDHALAVVHALEEDRLVELFLEGTSMRALRRGALPADSLRIDRAFAGVFLPNGEVWVGNDLAGLLVLGADGALTVLDPNVALACLVVHGEDVFLCGDDFPDALGDGFSVARQRIGAPYAPVAVLRYEDIAGPLASGASSDVTCAERWPETLVDLGRASPFVDAGTIDSSSDAALDGGTTALHEAGPIDERPVGSSCACRSAHARSWAAWPWLAGLVAWLARARARRPRHSAA